MIYYLSGKIYHYEIEKFLLVNQEDEQKYLSIHSVILRICYKHKQNIRDYCNDDSDEETKGIISKEELHPIFILQITIEIISE